jgi:organic radical activating enzyme
MHVLECWVPPIAQISDALHACGFEIAFATNGAVAAPAGLDWVSVSPNERAALVQVNGDELKLVYPQAGAASDAFAGLAFRNFFLQPMDGPNLAENTELALRYCLDHPQWRLSLQTHKILGIP